MSIPDCETLLLKILADGAEHPVEEIRDRVKNQFGVTRSGAKQKNKARTSLFVNRRVGAGTFEYGTGSYWAYQGNQSWSIRVSTRSLTEEPQASDEGSLAASEKKPVVQTCALQVCGFFFSSSCCVRCDSLSRRIRALRHGTRHSFHLSFRASPERFLRGAARNLQFALACLSSADLRFFGPAIF